MKRYFVNDENQIVEVETSGSIKDIERISHGKILYSSTEEARTIAIKNIFCIAVYHPETARGWTREYKNKLVDAVSEIIYGSKNNDRV